jgi:hypothetical protein
MITSIEFRSIVRELNITNLETHWNGYFNFRDQTRDLHAITEIRLLDAIREAKTTERPFIDSQQVVGGILTALGSAHNFHRQFNEAFPDLKPHQTLGMQLYALMVNDEDVWVYHETHHATHLFPHATYFIPRPDEKYQRLVRSLIS